MVCRNHWAAVYCHQVETADVSRHWGCHSGTGNDLRRHAAFDVVAGHIGLATENNCVDCAVPIELMGKGIYGLAVLIFSGIRKQPQVRDARCSRPAGPPIVVSGEALDRCN